MDIQTGKVSRKVSLLQNVTVRKKKRNGWKTESTSLEANPRSEKSDQSNLLVEDYHFFRSYIYNYLGRVNVNTGKVEYLQLPVSLLREPDCPDELIWNESDLASKPEKTFNVPTDISYWTFKTNRMVKIGDLNCSATSALREMAGGTLRLKSRPPSVRISLSLS